MAISPFKKAGWRWTAKGWKKAPRKPSRVKLAATPRKNHFKKKRRIMPTTPKPAGAPQMAAGQGGADSAATPASEAAKPTPRPPRAAWHGKYDDLAKPE